jgi:prepilin-type N-terminal cleavage/methylation domain-containing protein
MMRFRAGFTLIELMVVIVIIGILASIAIANYVNMKNHANEAHVKSDVHTVQLAVEDYGVQNEGRYSDAAADLTPLLPNGELLVNAFTRDTTEPQFGVAANGPGQVGVEAVQVSGLPTAYTVTGFGKAAIIMTVRGGH